MYIPLDFLFCLFDLFIYLLGCAGSWASHVALVLKNMPANAGDIRDVGSIPGSGRSPGGEQGDSLHYSCWRIPWTEEPGGLQSIESWGQTQLKRLSTRAHIGSSCGTQGL